MTSMIENTVSMNKESKKHWYKRFKKAYYKKGYSEGFREGWTDGFINAHHPNSTIKKLFWRIYYIKTR